MAAAWTYDTTNKLFVIDASALDVNNEITIDARQAYSQVKLDWKNNDELNKFVFPLNSIGGQDIGGGSFIAAYIQLKDPWKIQFPTSDASITIVGNVITELGGDPFVDQPGNYHHVVKYVVSANSFSISQAELVAAIADIDVEVDAIATAVQTLPQDIWQLTDGVETNLTPAQAMQVIAAISAGKAFISGNTIRFRNFADDRDVVTATADGGQRTIVTINTV